MSVSSAWAAALDEDAYWAQLRQTDDLLQQAIAQPGLVRDSTLDHVRGLWQNVDSVRLADQSVISVDMRWLGVDLGNTDSALQTTRQRIRTLLDYHSGPGSKDTQAALAAHDHVMQDSRFHYNEITPVPETPSQSQRSTADSFFNATLAQLLLVGIGLTIMVAVLFSLARGLQIQRQAIPESDADQEEPVTSSAARELATGSEAARDYRTAIRYLYLSSLLVLDERGLIHYDRTLTNREHLWQVADQPRLVELLQPIVTTFDNVWYGFASVDEALYQEFRQNVERLRQYDRYNG